MHHVPVIVPDCTAYIPALFQDPVCKHSEYTPGRTAPADLIAAHDGITFRRQCRSCSLITDRADFYTAATPNTPLMINDRNEKSLLIISL